MKRKSLITADKKGLNYYSPLIAIMGIFILGAILSNLFVRQYNLASEFDLGREQFRILLAHSSAEKALLFVDDAARLALENAAYSYGKNGFYQSARSCGSSNGFNFWTMEQSQTQNDCVPQMTPCYPDEETMKSTFRSFFITAFVSFVKGFNEKSGLKFEDGSIIVPFSYESLALSTAPGRTEITGLSKRPVSIVTTKTNPLRYEIKPSFRESITPDVIANGKGVVSKAPQLLRKKAGEINSVLDSFNSQDPSLQWKLASYSAPSTTCSYVIGRCSYCCSYDVDAKGRSFCSRTCEKDNIETVYYNNVSAAFSVANGRGFYVSDPPSTPPQLKSVAYNFGLNWLEQTGRTSTC